VASVVLMPRAFPGGSTAAALNLGMTFLTLGALVSPAAAERLVERFNFRYVVGLLALVCLVPALLAGIADDEGFRVAAADPQFARVFGHPLVWLAALAFALYLPVETSLGAWFKGYLEDLD